MTDPFVGQLIFIRVYSGQLKTGDSVLNPRTGKTERIGRLLKMHANKREEITEILAGDICAAVGLKNLVTGDTICTDKNPVVLESIDFPAPVIEVAVEPKTKADQEKMGMALAKLAQEDPTFRVRTDIDSGQTIIAGMGELHLEIIVDRMMREYKVEANVGKPQVNYRETIRASAEAEGKYIRQTGGSGNYGHAKIRSAPTSPAKATSSAMTQRVARFRRSTSSRSTKVFRTRCSAAFWLATRWLTLRSRSMTAAIMMSTRTKWRSRSLVRWPSRKPPARRNLFCSSQ